ncbi:alkylation response protein AidB-like acyl-CoA dehydrogenase [Nocardioides marinisabuli]|uniref:Alkylation response protein AidB-like acyl-CoA dehydrogenase n=1 Tax=Nocardioides marinisabuli TaxID=419476 RepID=A0A7Y9F3J1_9ACTN|nr:acyl-CoA dehydrogenase family protein [Nocardioides marinisabuli]NYD58935.1 alkylation response protein AidB-like acyl-CoA dehydrogenase [Nocardioides marinisabuli]
MKRDLYEQEHEDFRASAAGFVRTAVAPHWEQWEEDGIIDRAAWTAAGRLGLLGVAVPEELGGGGVADFRYRTVLIEELCAIGANSFNASLSVQDDLVMPYLVDLGTDEQRTTWLPQLCRGEAIGALALTEPGAGSDLRGIRTTARRSGSGWRLDGAKTFITNGYLADVVVVLARVEPAVDAGAYALFVVPADRPGFGRGRKLDKLGLRANDTAELVFDDVALRDEDLLGIEGRGLAHVMERLPRERMSIAATSAAASAAALDWTRRYCFERSAFGRPIGDFQATRFTLAEIETDVDAATSLLDRAIGLLDAGELTAVDAAKVKYWISDLHQRVVDRCLQLHGGYGYMREYPIARSYADARIQPIYGGTNEIMKDIIGRDIAARAASR